MSVLYHIVPSDQEVPAEPAATAGLASAESAVEPAANHAAEAVGTAAVQQVATHKQKQLACHRDALATKDAAVDLVSPAWSHRWNNCAQ